MWGISFEAEPLKRLEVSWDLGLQKIETQLSN